MSDLITRLEEAAEGSRELDAAICIAFQYGGANREGGLNIRTDDDWEGDLLYDIGAEECCCPIPPVTTSLDAALALAERVLAVTCRSGLQENPDRTWSAAILRVYPDDREGPVADAATPALAICIAILRANHKDKP